MLHTVFRPKAINSGISTYYNIIVLTVLGTTGDVCILGKKKRK
jgi:hypothetical protein